MKIQLQHILALLLLLCSSACSDRKVDLKVDGEVFIRTRGGETIPLSLVEVGFNDLNETYNVIHASYERKPPVSLKELFAVLPRPSITTKTDAQGHFTVSVPAGKQFAVIAQDVRSVGSKREQYYWCVTYRSTGSEKTGKIVLANDNLVAAGPSGNSLIYLNLLDSK